MASKIMWRLPDHIVRTGIVLDQRASADDLNEAVPGMNCNTAAEAALVAYRRIA